MSERIIVSGFGGQGALSAGLMLAEAAVRMGMEATYFPAYGAEMRGGTANCQIIISETRIGSPLISEADTLFALNEPSVEKFLPKVKDGGLVILNSSVITKEFDYGDRRVFNIPLDELALENLGTAKVANIIMLGIYLKSRAIISTKAIKTAIHEKFLKKGEKVIQMNYAALDLGYSLNPA